MTDVCPIYSPTGVPATDDRRTMLLGWLQRRVGERTTDEIMQASGLYRGNGHWDKAHSDLKALAKQGCVRRVGYRPSRWVST